MNILDRPHYGLMMRWHIRMAGMYLRHHTRCKDAGETSLRFFGLQYHWHMDAARFYSDELLNTSIGVEVMP